MASAASVGGHATGTESVGVATWGATASPPSATFTSNTDKTSTITNSGTVALSAQSFAVTVSNPASGAPTFKVYLCTVAWVGSTCSHAAGTPVGGTIPSNSTTTITSTTPLAIGAALYLQVEPSGIAAGTTVSVSLAPEVRSPSQLRAAVKTNQ